MLCPILRLGFVESRTDRIKDHEEITKSCSYCLKTKKNCTRYWARSQLRGGGGGTGNTSHARNDARSGKRQRTEKRTMSQSDMARHDVAGLLELAQPLPQDPEMLAWDSIALSLAAIPSRRHDSQASMALTGESSSDGASSQTDIRALFDECHGASEDSSAGADSMLTALTDSDLQAIGLEQSECSGPAFSQDYSDTGGFADTSHPAQDAMGAAPQTSERLQPTVNWLQQASNPLSPSSIEHTMMFRTDNSFISQNLLRVYHDVFEHNLSCWVSGESCPYKMTVRKKSDSPGTALASNPAVQMRGGAGLIQEEWGAAWSNRIYSRVINLDRAAQSSKIVRLTPAEDRAVMKAFHLAIMAFSSQWAHQSRREREKYPSTSGSETQDFNNSDDLADEFDRLIQRSFWEQARKALDNCAELECYRVVCAELIFGLTQKPWDRDDPGPDVSGDSPLAFALGLGGMDNSVMAQVQSIISKDGPPVFIERAARKVHALKFRFEAFDAGLMKANRDHDYPYQPDSTMIISARDRETAGFVYWLAVMFDTISASMYQRPVVVTDEDSQHDAVDEEELAEPERRGESGSIMRTRRWSISHFIQDNPNWPRQPLRWPCSYEDAARTVTRSGPVKILLYRHVSYLQDAIRRRQRGEAIEHIIRNAVLVYCYWNVTYGVFFRDLIENYDTVPPRIQSWFFCIHAHWHLAAMILADLIESVDYNELGDAQAKQERLGSATVNTIRRASAGELSDLARITTPSDWTERMNPPSPQLPDFHSAVNQGAILTEPWTMILIRAFSKAFVWHLNEVELWRFNGCQNYQDSLAQCQDCARALWYLGRKSDMARNVAMALSKALAMFEAQNA